MALAELAAGLKRSRHDDDAETGVSVPSREADKGLPGQRCQVLDTQQSQKLEFADQPARACHCFQTQSVRQEQCSLLRFKAVIKQLHSSGSYVQGRPSSCGSTKMVASISCRECASRQLQSSRAASRNTCCKRFSSLAKPLAARSPQYAERRSRAGAETSACLRLMSRCPSQLRRAAGGTQSKS